MSFRDLLPTHPKRGEGVRHHAYHPISTLRSEMDKLIDDFDFPTVWGNGLEQSSLMRTDISETEKFIEVAAELPGLDEKDIAISLRDDCLTIRAEKENKKEEEGRDFLRTERTYGSFNRSFILPCAIDEEKIKASFKNGILNIELPKAKSAVKAERKIAIKSS